MVLWLCSAFAFAFAFHDLCQEKTDMVSKKSNPMIVKEDWLNDLLECLLTLLARGISFSHGENIGEQSFNTDYLEAIHFLDQEDIRMLMPEPKGLHDFCSMPCVAMEIYLTHTRKGKSRIKISMFQIQNPEWLPRKMMRF
jgi:hypothetical protein